MSRSISYQISEEFNGMKIKYFLRGEKQFSSRLLCSLKKENDGILLNGVHARVIDVIKTGDVLTVNIPNDNNEIEPVEIDFDIIYEDNDILVINKPSGLAMHPTHNHQGDTLANGVASYLSKKGKNNSFRAVGRLDKETSGIVLCALNKYSAAFLSDKYKKEYVAIVGGLFFGEGTINKRIYRPDMNKSSRWVGDEGDDAITHWTAVACDGKRTFLKINLETGRTHQIRVHFASENAPLCGDDMYGSIDTSINRVALHCMKMWLCHPVTGEEMSFTAPLPQDMKNVIEDNKFNWIITNEDCFNGL